MVCMICIECDANPVCPKLVELPKTYKGKYNYFGGGTGDYLLVKTDDGIIVPMVCLSGVLDMTDELKGIYGFGDTFKAIGYAAPTFFAPEEESEDDDG